MEKVLVRVVCRRKRSQELVEVITGAARTGKRGDGIISVHPMLDVVKIRTGDRGPEALR